MIYLHYRPAFGLPTACGLGFLAHASDDPERTTCPACLGVLFDSMGFVPDHG
jgi:hypothetical protein